MAGNETGMSARCMLARKIVFVEGQVHPEGTSTAAPTMGSRAVCVDMRMAPPDSRGIGGCQVGAELVEQPGRALFASVDAVEPVEVDALLGVGQPGALALRFERDGYLDLRRARCL